MDRNQASAESQAQNHISKQDIWLSVALGAMLAFAAGVASVGYPTTASQHADHTAPVSHTIADTAPDWTVAPCSWFADGRTIPAFTRTDVCALPDGTLSVAGK